MFGAYKSPVAGTVPFQITPGRENGFSGENVQTAIEEALFAQDKIAAARSYSVPAERQIKIAHEYRIDGVVTVEGTLEVS